MLGGFAENASLAQLPTQLAADAKLGLSFGRRAWKRYGSRAIMTIPVFRPELSRLDSTAG